MPDFSEIKDYIPIIVAVLTVLLTYLFGVRKGKKDKFRIQMEENLGGILSPVVHMLRVIIREESAYRREELLKEFFLNFSSEKTKLYKISNNDILQWYYKTEDSFYKFNSNRETEDWKSFWVHLDILNNMIIREYKSTRGIIYSDYKWLMDLNQRNPFVKIFTELFILIYEFLKFIVTSSLVLMIGFLVDNIQAEQLIPTYIKQIVILVFMLSLVSSIILSLFLQTYCMSKQMHKESYIRTVLEKGFPKFYSVWDTLTQIDIEKGKAKSNIPEMYQEEASYNIVFPIYHTLR